MKRRIGVVALMASASIAAIASPAMAQEIANAPAASPASAEDVAASPEEDIIVTGSRIARSTFETPTPVTAITEKQLQQKAATTVNELLIDVPALVPNQVQASGRSIGVSNFNMRSLGANRTLVLLDGQRLMDSSPLGGFDLNVLPAPLISRMEIVTAGASSVYGSDAITGVVNVIIDSKFTGLKLDTQFGISSHGDQHTYSVSGAYGTSFADDRGHLVVAASYLNRPDILYQGRRDWGSRGTTLIPNAAYTSTNGQFRQLIADNVKLSQQTPGGVITTNGALKNIQFGVNGAQSRFQQGTNVGTTWMEGGEGELYQPLYGVLIPAIRQASVFGRASYDIGSNTEVFVDFIGTHSKAHSTNTFNYNNADIRISRDNAFLPQNIRDLMVANNLQTINIGRINSELGLNDNYSINHYYRVGGGLKGKLSSTWNWDIQANYTYSLAANYGYNNRNNANWTRALDAVIGPNGAPICRSTLADPTNGCAPANIFGINSVSSAAAAYATGTSYQRSHSRSFDINANVAGELGNTWAGPIKVALGAEWRRNTVNSVSDPISDISGWRQGTFASFKGAVSVAEVYGETSIPLGRDSYMMKSVDLDLAARYVNYSTSGSTAVWKVGLNWAFDDHIRFRSTYSKDFRAPTLFDLFSASSKGAGQNVIDTVGQGTNPNYNKGATADLISGGNPNLRPELAHTFTAGVVVQPAFAPGLSFSADYFSIKLKDALIQLGAQQVVDRCRDGDPAACAAITRTGGVISQVNTTQFNALSIETNGIDFEASYRIPVGAGQLGLRAVATYTAHLKTITGATTTDTAGQTSVPHWRGTGTISYERGPFDARAQFTYIGPGTFDNTFGPFDINRNHFPAYVYTSLSASYFVTKNLQLYAKVDNLFDTDPPLLPGNTTGTARATNAQNYDLRGRFFGFGARLRY